MTHVVTESCIGCKYTDCVAVCPVECFHEGPNFLVIDPDVCIDCGICVAECPVEAIFDAKDLAPDQADFAQINVRLIPKWPLITKAQEPLPDAALWADKKDKRGDLVEMA